MKLKSRSKDKELHEKFFKMRDDPVDFLYKELFYTVKEMNKSKSDEFILETFQRDMNTLIKNMKCNLNDIQISKCNVIREEDFLKQLNENLKKREAEV